MRHKQKIKKLIHGTQQGLDRNIERQKANGWIVDRTEIVPRGSATSKFMYIAYLIKNYN